MNREEFAPYLDYIVKGMIKERAISLTHQALELIKNDEISVALIDLEKAMDILKCKNHLGNSPWDPR